jgi:hypothetical protein
VEGNLEIGELSFRIIGGGEGNSIVRTLEDERGTCSTIGRDEKCIENFASKISGEETT